MKVRGEADNRSPAEATWGGRTLLVGEFSTKGCFGSGGFSAGHEVGPTLAPPCFGWRREPLPIITLFRGRQHRSEVKTCRECDPPTQESWCHPGLLCGPGQVISLRDPQQLRLGGGTQCDLPYRVTARTGRALHVSLHRPKDVLRAPSCRLRLGSGEALTGRCSWPHCSPS